MTTCVYIASPSFSGSTLLTMLLGGSPGVATVGEMKGGQEDLATYGCSCGALFIECPFWTKLTAELKRRGFVYDLSDRRTMPAFFMPGSNVGDRFMRCAYGSAGFERVRDAVLSVWPGCKERVAHVRRYTEAFIELVLQANGARVFVDSSKDPVRIKYLAGIPSLSLKVVHLIRDGRGVTNSAKKNMQFTAELAATEWRDTHLEIERVSRRYCPGHMMRLMYEELCAEPEAVLTRVLQFAGLPESYHLAAAAERELHVLGNRMRLKGALPIRLDESWTQQLSDGELEIFERVGGCLNARYGYRAGREALAAVS